MGIGDKAHTNKIELCTSLLLFSRRFFFKQNMIRKLENQNFTWVQSPKLQVVIFLCSSTSSLIVFWVNRGLQLVDSLTPLSAFWWIRLLRKLPLPRLQTHTPHLQRWHKWTVTGANIRLRNIKWYVIIKWDAVRCYVEFFFTRIR